VQTIKHLLQKAEDPYYALLVYRATPLQNGYSPAELLMNRRLRTDLPTVFSQLIPSVPDMADVREKEAVARKHREDNFDRLHRAKSLEPLTPGDYVWISDRRESGVVTEQVAPRSYNISTPGGEYRRNRRHLNILPDDSQDDSEPQSEPQSSQLQESPCPSKPDSPPTSESPARGPTVASNQPDEMPGVVRTRSGRISVKRTFFDPSHY